MKITFERTYGKEEFEIPAGGAVEIGASAAGDLAVILGGVFKEVNGRMLLNGPMPGEPYCRFEFAPMSMRCE